VRRLLGARGVVKGVGDDGYVLVEVGNGESVSVTPRGLALDTRKLKMVEASAWT
jgi:hypothetical protein